MGGLRGIDMFRKIPADLTSATTTGASVELHAIDATPAQRRGGVNSSPRLSQDGRVIAEK